MDFGLSPGIDFQVASNSGRAAANRPAMVRHLPSEKSPSAVAPRGESAVIGLLQTTCGEEIGGGPVVRGGVCGVALGSRAQNVGHAAPLIHQRRPLPLELFGQSPCFAERAAVQSRKGFFQADWLFRRLALGEEDRNGADRADQNHAADGKGDRANPAGRQPSAQTAPQR